MALHARKMAALLQASTGSGRPVIIRYETIAGHTGDRPMSQRIDEAVDIVSFLLWQTSGLAH